jgi:hypothetical protein
MILFLFYSNFYDLKTVERTCGVVGMVIGKQEIVLPFQYGRVAIVVGRVVLQHNGGREGGQIMTDAIGQYINDVKTEDFPNENERY